MITRIIIEDLSPSTDGRYIKSKREVETRMVIAISVFRLGKGVLAGSELFKVL